ncbi:Protein ENHANCED DISEASE RESISTANCE 2 [Camellia lanceoleosa]|uniref:Protein ENHANCED DISEASE RESISTANCE 2 n=1 Tax=Camellia lanceoleosa TaxID=1840588 RepID=A0ACC0HZA8_9ERIC|nr:Protein ENHANCED DISEASE RESISTANCE 2 [Camellia lanceoleosa]
MCFYFDYSSLLNFCRFSVPEDEEDDSHANFLGRTTIGNGCFWFHSFWLLIHLVLSLADFYNQYSFVNPPESIFDWTTEDSDLSNQNTNNQAFFGKHWCLLQCQNS